MTSLIMLVNTEWRTRSTSPRVGLPENLSVTETAPEPPALEVDQSTKGWQGSISRKALRIALRDGLRNALRVGEPVGWAVTTTLLRRLVPSQSPQATSTSRPGTSG